MTDNIKPVYMTDDNKPVYSVETWFRGGKGMIMFWSEYTPKTPLQHAEEAMKRGKDYNAWIVDSGNICEIHDERGVLIKYIQK